MSGTERWQRVRAIFQAALEEPPEARDAFLSGACGGDEALRGEVRSLLAAHASAGGFMETPAFRLADAPHASPDLTLEVGDRLGRFEVTALLGTGGMGEVYRARDTQLGREVAIKVLPPSFAADPQRRARFERESRVLASLRHPNIATIHSIEELDGLWLLVLELVEGPTLAEKVKAGPVTLRETLDIASQLAGALDAAHAGGVVHRDLKPANVKITTSGRVTLLDFGLAKARQDDEGGPATLTSAGLETTAGMILGTFGYMSPEQARGRPVDKRADIWAFGCILFELLAGQPVFHGETPSDVVAAVLERQPDWSLLPDGLPPAVRRLLRRCLEKDPERRLHDIADARLDIDEARQEAEAGRHPEGAGPGSPAREAAAGRRRVAGWLVPAMLATGALALGWWGRDLVAPAPVPERLVRFTWSLPAGLALTSAPAVSPDGQDLAYTASERGARPMLFVRRLSALEPQAIPRTEGAKQPFWSPDGQSLGYFAGGRLMRVVVDGGSPVEICGAPDGRGGTWNRNGTIVFSPDLIYAGLLRVPAVGGTPEPATLLDRAQGENSHRWPVFLPDGTHFVYFVRSLVAERRGVYLGSIDGPAARPGVPLFRSESEAVFAPLDAGNRGVFLSVADGHVEARVFDTRRLALVGDPVRMPLPAGGNTPHHGAMLSASANAVMYLAEAMPYGSRMASVLRTGAELQRDDARAIVNWPRLSPDGTRLAIQRLDAATGSPDLWVEDLARGTWLRVTGDGSLPVWSPDSRRLAYVAGTFQEPRVAVAAADGSGELATVPCPTFRCEPSDWTHDGRWIVVNALDQGGTSSDVWMLPATADDRPRPLLAAPFVERDARLSPDGSLVAYVSEETGRPEISLRAVGGEPNRQVLSAGGGSQPVWRRDGTELLFVDPDGLLRSIPVRRAADGHPILGLAVPLNVPRLGTGHYSTQYDLSPDGQRLFFLDRQPGDPPREIGVVLGWRTLLGR